MPAEQDEFAVRLRDAKLAALAEFAAGAGHEINNPVATIVGRAQQLLRDEADPNRRHALATIVAQAFRIRDMIGDLMLFARPPEPQPVWFDVLSSIHEVVDPFRDALAERGVSLSVHGDDAAAFADPLQFQIAVSELVKNALTASHRGGEISVAVTRLPKGIEVMVTDNGEGFTETDLEHAFDPFYSGRQAGRGLGFGLPKVWRIVTLAGGSIRLRSTPGETIAQLSLPNPVPDEMSGG